MNTTEWLERATVFDLGLFIFYKRPVKIEARDQLTGVRLWVVKMQEWVLGKDGSFHYEPQPSSRTVEFIELTRFESPEAAHKFWRENITEAKPLKL